MNINLSVVRRNKKTGRVVCFMHAVQLANMNISIEEEIDEFGASGNDMRNTSCWYCSNGASVKETI